MESEIKPLQSFHEKEIGQKIQRMIVAEQKKRDRREYKFESEPLLESIEERTDEFFEEQLLDLKTKKQDIARKLGKKTTTKKSKDTDDGDE